MQKPTEIAIAPEHEKELRRCLAGAFLANADVNEASTEAFLLTLMEMAAIVYNEEWADPNAERFKEFAVNTFKQVQQAQALKKVGAAGSC